MGKQFWRSGLFTPGVTRVEKATLRYTQVVDDAF